LGFKRKRQWNFLGGHYSRVRLRDLEVHVVDDARLEGEGSHGTSEGNEVPKERKQSSKECADSDVGASGDEAHKHTVKRPITLILPGKVCVHELIHWCCIDLYTQASSGSSSSPLL